MNEFLLGILAGIATAIIIYLSRFYFTFIINAVFFRVYLNISGEYKMYQYDTSSRENGEEELEERYEGDTVEYKPSLDDPKAVVEWLREGDEEPYYTIKLKQFANNLVGEIEVIENGSITHRHKVKGKITPTRVVLLTAESKTQEHHDFGTLLLRVTQNVNIMRGGYDYLCITCGNVGSAFIFLEKVK